MNIHIRETFVICLVLIKSTYLELKQIKFKIRKPTKPFNMELRHKQLYFAFKNLDYGTSSERWMYACIVKIFTVEV